MNVDFFLGANSGGGFYSLYDGFARNDGDFLYLIKGGPGCGKSGFMRKISEKARERGYDTETILCSGDPESLDGLYIPALKLGFCDATAPHITEPRLFAYDSCYVNLGQFCRPAHDPHIAQYTREYKSHYSAAYSYLSAAQSVKTAAIPGLIAPEHRKIAAQRAENTVKRLIRFNKGGLSGSAARRFIRCISCRGELFLSDTADILCKRVYRISDRFGLSDTYLKSAEKTALTLGAKVISCPSPLCPEELDAVILPEFKLGFVSGSACGECSSYRNIRLDAQVSSDSVREHKAEIKRRELLYTDLISAAVSYLERAKSAHDLLEARYKPYMDFAALDKFTEDFISELF